MDEHQAIAIVLQATGREPEAVRLARFIGRDEMLQVTAVTDDHPDCPYHSVFAQLPHQRPHWRVLLRPAGSPDERLAEHYVVYHGGTWARLRDYDCAASPMDMLTLKPDWQPRPRWITRLFRYRAMAMLGLVAAGPVLLVAGLLPYRIGTPICLVGGVIGGGSILYLWLTEWTRMPAGPKRRWSLVYTGIVILVLLGAVLLIRSQPSW